MTPTLYRYNATNAATAITATKPFEAPSHARRPQHVVGEEKREIDDDADDRRGDAGKRRGEFEVAVRGLDERARRAR